MAISLDASTPAAVSTSATTALSTAAFSPPANSLLVALVGLGSASGALTPTVTLSGATFTAITENTSSGNGEAGIWYSLVGGIAPGSITITATQVGTATGDIKALAVLVLTGTDLTNPIGAKINARQVGAGSGELALTTTTVGSYVVGVVTDDIAQTGPSTPDANTLTVGTFVPATNANRVTLFKPAALVTTPGSTTYGYPSYTSTDAGVIAIAEILPPGTAAAISYPLPAPAAPGRLGPRHGPRAHTPAYVTAITSTTNNFTSTLTASLGLSSASTNSVSTTCTAAVGFTGALARSFNVLRLATLAFTGAQGLRTSHGVGGSVGFTGTQTRSLLRSLLATLGFTGSETGVKPSDPIFRAAATATTTVANSSSNTANLASTTVGDINIVVINVTSATVTTADPGVPTINGSSIAAAGWNLIDSSFDTAASGASRLTIAWRIFQTGDASTITWAWTGSTGDSAAGAVAYRTGTFNSTTPIPTDGHSAQTQVPSSTSFATPSVTTGERGLVLSIFSNRTAGTWTAPSGDTARLTGAATSSSNFLISEAPAASAPGTYSKTATFSAATSVGNQGIVLLASNPAGGGGATNYTQTLTAALTFTGLGTNGIRHGLTAGLTFTGSQTRAITRTLLAALSLTGALPKNTARVLTATLGLAGSLGSAAVHHFTQALTATLAFVGALPRNTSSRQSAAVGFAGTQSRSIRTSRTAALSFTGALPRSARSGQTANLSFTGTRTSRTARAFTATVSFTGAMTTAAVHHFTQTFTAALAFVGSAPRLVSTARSATLSFTGTQPRALSRQLTAALNFAGALPRRITPRQFTAAVSFAGTMTSAAVHHFTQTLSATVGFTGSLTTAAVHRFLQTFTATLGFTGSQIRLLNRAFSGNVGFTGSQTRSTRRTNTASLVMTGSTNTRVSSHLSAAITFTGSVTRRSARVLIAAVSFIGSVVAGRTFGRVFTATVGFTVASFRRTQPRLAATLSSTGNLARTIRTRIPAALGFTVLHAIVPHLISALNNLRIRMSGRENSNHLHGTEDPRTLAGRRSSTVAAGTEPDTTVAVRFNQTSANGTEEGT